MTTCKLCYRLIKDAQDTATLHDYPTVGTGRVTVHYMCLRIRTCQARNVDPSAYSGRSVASAARDEQRTCAYCAAEIGVSDDFVEFKLCAHTSVHLLCMMRFDFTRRAGCVFCYTEEKATAAINAWHDDDDKKSMLIQSYIASASTAAATTTARDASAPDGVMLHTDSVYGLYAQSMAPAVITAQYNSQKYRLKEPVHSTALRRVVHELNIDHGDARFSHIAPHGPDVYHTLILEHKYTVGDLVQTGLTLPIVLSNPNTTRTFVHHYFFDGALPKQFVGKHALLTLALAGMPLTYIFERARKSTIVDAQWLDFSIPVCLAAGVGIDAIRAFLDMVTRSMVDSPSIESVMPYFGATREIIFLFK